MTTQIIYILNANGEPLMPTHRLGKVRRWLSCGEAHWFGNSRTTIQFDRPVGNTTQNCIEGVDLGNHLGISVVCTTTNQELYNGISQRNYQGEVKRNVKRREYRRTRRNRLRHRKARFSNRKKPDGWLAPSIQHYIDFTINEILRIQKFLPISKVILETSVFDTAKLTNFGIRPKDYTKGAFLMNVMHLRLPKRLNNKPLQLTFGYKTARQRQLYGFKKDRNDLANHAIDALLIANGNNHTELMTDIIYREKHHRNNRSLEKFYDAKYYSNADGKIYTGKELGSGRTNRKQPRTYNSKRSERGCKKAKGRRSIRHQHYQFQPHDKILWKGKIVECLGTINKGGSVLFKLNNKRKSSMPKKLKLLHRSNSLIETVIRR